MLGLGGIETEVLVVSLRSQSFIRELCGAFEDEICGVVNKLYFIRV